MNKLDVMIDVNCLKFNACAYFYKLKDKVEIAQKAIKQMLCDVTEGKPGPYLFNICRANIGNARYSMCVFKDNPRTPKFIGVQNEQWQEQKIGYYVFIECDRYVAILKKNCTVPSGILSKLENIEHDTLIRLFSDDDTKVNKLSMQNLDGSDYAMRYKSYESLDLRDNLSPIGATHYYIRSFKGDKKGDRFTLTLSTSRINNFASDQSLANICEWVCSVVDGIKKSGKGASDFFDIFAKPIKYTELKDSLQPSKVLLFYSLIDSLRNEQGAVFYRRIKGEEKSLEDDEFKELIAAMQVCYGVERESDGRYYARENRCIEVRKLKNEIKLRNDDWKNVIIKGSSDGLYDGTLIDLINRNSLFNVYFLESPVVYSNRTLFEDTKLLSSGSRFMKDLKGKLNGEFSCEKYEGRSSRGLKDWSDESIFKYVESEFAREYTYFICDDLGTEWADHIGISKGRVTFFVEKYKESQDSASDFQEVVGQALKNIGNLTPTKAQLESKKEKWRGKYGEAKFLRYRSETGSVDEAIKVWLENNSMPNCEREMCLVVNFLSCDKFKDQLEDLSNGGNVQRAEELRMRLWLLSSFVDTCREAGVKPVIYCRQ
jgi:hypothetical protein psyrpo1_36959